MVTLGVDENGNVTFATTRRLLPREGLTIAVAWPKGIVAEPTSLDKAGYMLRDNRGVLVGLAGLLILFIYYLWTWFRVGRDPAKGTIIPLFSPPKDFSPAAVRFVMRMGFDDKSFAAAVVNMAVKGFLTITEDEDGVFTLQKTRSGESGLSMGEKRVMHRLFRTRGTIRLKNNNHADIQGAILALKKSLKMHFEKIYFFRNSRYLLPGLIWTLLTLGAVILMATDRSKACFMTVWLSIWTTGCFFLVAMGAKAWKSALQREGGVYSGITGLAMQDNMIAGTMDSINDRTFEHLSPSDEMIARMRRKMLRMIAAHEKDKSTKLPGVDEPELYRNNAFRLTGVAGNVVEKLLA